MVKNILEDHPADCKCRRPSVMKKKDCKCNVCKKEVKEVLDLCGTSKNICSVQCERTFWLDILY